MNFAHDLHRARASYLTRRWFLRDCGVGLAGIAGSSFTMLASTGPTTGQQYIVDTFIVVVFGGVESLIGTVASAFIIGQMQSWFEYSLSGSMARAERHR